jgi:class 3 adenylate cyclase
MTKIHPERPDPDPFDHSLAADVLLRQEPDDEEDEEEEEEGKVTTKKLTTRETTTATRREHGKPTITFTKLVDKLQLHESSKWNI